MTVATGTAVARVASASATAPRARTAGSAVIGWNATMSAGRQASAARATLPYTGAMTVRRTADRTRGESLARQNSHHSQGVSRMQGP